MEIFCSRQSASVTCKWRFSVCVYYFTFGHLFTEIAQVNILGGSCEGRELSSFVFLQTVWSLCEKKEVIVHCQRFMVREVHHEALPNPHNEGERRIVRIRTSAEFIFLFGLLVNSVDDIRLNFTREGMFCNWISFHEPSNCYLECLLSVIMSE